MWNLDLFRCTQSWFPGSQSSHSFSSSNFPQRNILKELSISYFSDQFSEIWPFLMTHLTSHMAQWLHSLASTCSCLQNLYSITVAFRRPPVMSHRSVLSAASTAPLFLSTSRHTEGPICVFLFFLKEAVNSWLKRCVWLLLTLRIFPAGNPRDERREIRQCAWYCNPQHMAQLEWLEEDLKAFKVSKHLTWRSLIAWH